jgi:hypothetical protein
MDFCTANLTTYQGEVETLTNLIMKSDIDWDPSSYENIVDNMDQF